MDTRFDFSFTKPQIIEVFKKHSRKSLRVTLATAIVLLCLSAVLAAIHFTVEKARVGSIAEWFAILDLILWVLYVFVRRSAPKNAERYFKYNATDDVVAYSYELTSVDFVISQPTLGNVWHYKYDTIARVVDLDGYAAVMLESNQFLPILANERTAPLINTLKSFAKIKK